MGAAGAGKTTVGRLLADRLGCAFADADDFHSASNVAKMRDGVALTDADREPWLDRMHEVLRASALRGQSLVLACSALKQAYRDLLTADVSDVRLVYLKADPALLRARVTQRRDHYMPATLVDSQIATLEEPSGAVVVDASQPPEGIVDELAARIRLGER